MSDKSKINHNQYFTPQFVASKALKFISRRKIKTIIDPAVGEGVFLNESLKLWPTSKLFGIDIDKKIIDKLKNTSLSKHLFLKGNSLLFNTWENPVLKKILLNGGFDLTVGNPPFSSKSNLLRDKNLLSKYNITKHVGAFKSSLPIELIFLEIFLNLTKHNGIIIIVLPDGILSNPKYKFVREFILENSIILKIIDLPREVFEKTSAKTSILVLQKRKVRKLDYKVEINDLEKNGTVNNTINVKASSFLNRMDYYYHLKKKNCSIKEINRKKFKLKKLKNYVKYVTTGDTVYGENRKFSKNGVKFIHSTDIDELGFNFKYGVKYVKKKSNMYFDNAHTKLNDILFIRVGSGCIGKTAIILKRRNIGVVSDCLYRLKVKNISPFYVFLYLKSKFAKDWIDLQKHGIGSSCFTINQLLSLPIPILPKKTENSLSAKFVTILRKFDECKKTVTKMKMVNNYNKLKMLLEKKLTCND